MYAANTYKIRTATTDDADGLRRLAELDSQRPLGGSVLIGELDGTPAAAIALADGRVVADPFRPTAHLVASMRTRAAGLVAGARTPSLRERLLAALPVADRARPAGA
jgi:hypothetical protein